jgi:hypothetical protein
MLSRFQPGSLVSSVITDSFNFYGVVREVNHKENKVYVAWGDGAVSQHDPDEIMLYPGFLSDRRVASADIVSFDEETAEDNEQFMGDPEIHGLDEPRGGGFSIMQDLQDDLHKESIKQRGRRSTYTVRNLPPGAEIVQDHVRYPTDNSLGTAIKLSTGDVIWSDPWGYTRPFPESAPFKASVKKKN